MVCFTEHVSDLTYRKRAITQQPDALHVDKSAALQARNHIAGAPGSFDYTLSLAVLCAEVQQHQKHRHL